MGTVNTSTQKFGICGLQSGLREVGLYKSKIDGMFGDSCVKAFGTVLGENFPSPGSFDAKDVFYAVQRALVAKGKDTGGVDGVWGSNSQKAFDAVLGDYRKAQGIPALNYAWSAHRGVPKEGIAKIEAWLTKWGKPLSHVSYLLSCMAFETGGTFNPAEQNKKSKATGLIQFMPANAKELGTSIEALAKMDFVTQLDYVFKYFEIYKYIVKCKTVEDYYLSIFYPARVGKSPDEILARKGTALYDQNKVFDKKDNKGYYTVGDICVSIVERYWEGMAPINRLQIK